MKIGAARRTHTLKGISMSEKLSGTLVLFVIRNDGPDAEVIDATFIRLPVEEQPSEQAGR